MKKSILTLSAIVYTSLSLFAQTVNIPDVNFKETLLKNRRINTNENNEIEVAEASAYTGTISIGSKKIKDLTGIEAFVNVTKLYCYNNRLKTLDLSNNKALKLVDCSRNQLTKLDFSPNIALEELTCSDNQLTELNIANGNNMAIEYMNATMNPNLKTIQIDRGFKIPEYGWSKDKTATFE